MSRFNHIWPYRDPHHLQWSPPPGTLVLLSPRSLSSPFHSPPPLGPSRLGEQVWPTHSSAADNVWFCFFFKFPFSSLRLNSHNDGLSSRTRFQAYIYIYFFSGLKIFCMLYHKFKIHQVIRLSLAYFHFSGGLYL